MDKWNILPEFPALQALVSTPAFIILGTAVIPALRAAMTNGDAEASPLLLESSGSFEGTIRDTTNIETTRNNEHKHRDFTQMTLTIKDHYAPEYSFCSPRDISSRGQCFGCRDRHVLNIRECIGRTAYNSPNTKELTPSTCDAQVLYEGTWVLPILEANSRPTWAKSKVDYKPLPGDQSAKFEVKIQRNLPRLLSQ